MFERSIITRLIREPIMKKPELVDGEHRVLGVQVMVVQPGDNLRDYMVFMRPETEEKRELYIWQDRGMIQNSIGRLNGAGGGLQPRETIRDAALREMRDELDTELGSGKLTILPLPRVACYQEVQKGNKRWGQLIGVRLVTYEPTHEEIPILEHIDGGRFTNLLSADFTTSHTGFETPGEIGWRPTFIVGLRSLIEMSNNSGDPFKVIRDYNKKVIFHGRHAARQEGLLFYPGVFSDQVTTWNELSSVFFH